MKVTKRRKTWSTLDAKKVYTLNDAIETLRGFCSKKFDESLEIAIKLGIDVTKADQNIRGMLSLPNGTGKSVRVAVFTVNSQEDAKKAGADQQCFFHCGFHRFCIWNPSSAPQMPPITWLSCDT
jgi:large subunit ribosomal protein L1